MTDMIDLIRNNPWIIPAAFFILGIIGMGFQVSDLEKKVNKIEAKLREKGIFIS